MQDINLELDNDDLGSKFYNRLISSSGIKLIDFDNFENNTFNVIMMFSNNLEYDTESITPVHGAFYATTSASKAFFNCFREEPKEFERLSIKLKPYDEKIENIVLKDTSNAVIKHSPEFATNKQITTPTNRLILSLFSQERLKYFLKHAITYVERKDKKDNRACRKISQYKIKI